MSETEVIDRAGWASGPWDAEGDRAEFVTAGFDCLLQRNRIGVWCGYVGLPEGHPWFERDYDAIDADAHGGLTWGGHNDPYRQPFTDPSADLWWIGFDCCHAGDYSPGMYRTDGTYPFHDDVYRDEAYARRETELLALAAAAVSE